MVHLGSMRIMVENGAQVVFLEKLNVFIIKLVNWIIDNIHKEKAPI